MIKVPRLVMKSLPFIGAFMLGYGTHVLLTNSREAPITDVTDSTGVVQAAGDPVSCVDLYYKAVLALNHDQYQFLVIAPCARETFLEKAKARQRALASQGLRGVDAPVRGRTEIRDADALPTATVFSLSPWTGQEEAYEVIRQGQGWKIKKEK